MVQSLGYIYIYPNVSVIKNTNLKYWRSDSLIAANPRMLQRSYIYDVTDIYRTCFWSADSAVSALDGTIDSPNFDTC